MGRRRLNLTDEERKERIREQRKKTRMKDREKRNAQKRVENLSPEKIEYERKRKREYYTNVCLKKKKLMSGAYSPVQNIDYIDSANLKTNCNYCDAPTFNSEDSKHCCSHQRQIILPPDVNYSTEIPIFKFENDSSTFDTSMLGASTSAEIETNLMALQETLGSTENIPWEERQPMTLFDDSDIKKELENKEINYLNEQLTEKPSVDSCLKVLEEHLSPTLLMLVKSQIQNKNKKLSALTYSNDLKYLSLNIYILSPKVYRLLQNPLSLPTNQILREILTEL